MTNNTNNNILLKYLSESGSQLVSEKSLKYFLPLIYPDVIKEISINKLSNYYDITLPNGDLKSKRFDFISLSLKLIIEFDGDQHFKFIEHFHTTYDNFMKQQRIDFEKHHFIKENNFNLIRISGNLTINQLFNLLKDIDFNLDEPKLILIKNTIKQVIYPDDLKSLDRNDIIQVYETKIEQLTNQVKYFISYNEKLKERLNLYENFDEVKQYKMLYKLDFNFDNQPTKTQIKNDSKNDSSNMVNENNWMHQFVEHGNVTGLFEFNQLKQSTITSCVKLFLKENNPGMTLPSSKTIIREWNKITGNLGYTLTDKRLRNLNLLNFNPSIVQNYMFDQFEDNNNQSYIYQKTKPSITKDNVDKFRKKINANIATKNLRLSIRELIMLDYLVDNGDLTAMDLKNSLSI